MREMNIKQRAALMAFSGVKFFSLLFSWTPHSFCIVSFLPHATPSAWATAREYQSPVTPADIHVCQGLLVAGFFFCLLYWPNRLVSRRLAR